MVQEYGYIENGYLRSRFLEPVKERYIDPETNELEERTVSVEEQLSKMEPGLWKPVRTIDESQRISDDPNYFIKLVPYDAGEYIDYHYVKTADTQKIRKRIVQLKEDLNSSDYKVIKCYEASLRGLALPYDIEEIGSSRQAIRNEINECETLLTEIQR